MFYEHQKRIALAILKNTPIETVFINARLLERDKEIFPIYREGNECIYIGLDDTKGLFSYIRQTGNIAFQVKATEGCNYIYLATMPCRLVVCGLFENFGSDGLVLNCLGLFKDFPAIIQQVITDENALFKLEHKVKQEVVFTEGSIYFAIDFHLVLPYSLTDCEAELKCLSLRNEFNKCDLV